MLVRLIVLASLRCLPPAVMYLISSCKQSNQTMPSMPVAFFGRISSLAKPGGSGDILKWWRLCYLGHVSAGQSRNKKNIS
jgi:hypothetical protein